MKTIDITVDSNGVCTLSDNCAGSCGEHNNLTLSVTPDLTFFKNCEYYRINIDGRYSGSLYLTEGKITYTVPHGALCPPVISCQVVGFKTVDDRSVLICRTRTFKLKVEPSPGAYVSINTDALEPLETALGLCGNAIVAAQNRIGELAEISEGLGERSQELETIASTTLAQVQKSVEEVSKVLADYVKTEDLPGAAVGESHFLTNWDGGAPAVLKDSSDAMNNIIWSSQKTMDEVDSKLENYVKTENYIAPNAPGLYNENDELTMTWEELKTTYPDAFIYEGAITGSDDNASFMPKISGKLVISNEITYIYSYAFSGCNNLVSVTIPDSVIDMSMYAFYGCTGLTSVTIGNGITYINDDVFEGCTGLRNITISNSAERIGMCTFMNCTSLTSLTIPDSVTEIDLGAFAGCTGLRSINIPDSVTEIKSVTFQNCINLKNVTIPNSVTSIGSSAFYGCDNLKNVYFKGTKEQWDKIVVETDNEALTNATIYCMVAY